MEDNYNANYSFGRYKMMTRYMQGICRIYVSYMQAICWLYVGYMLAICKLYAGDSQIRGFEGYFLAVR